jgi:hypothetical protein
LQREGMMAAPPWHCPSASVDAPNNFIARTIKLRGLAGRHKRNAWSCAWCNDEATAECHGLATAEMLLSDSEIASGRQWVYY